ncbi:MAG: cell division protein FtsZ [Candidatus Pacebacteria bacterium]|nr:cell division protein FtsZ [Candidatus Paceibacterota bacterium]
MPQVKPEIESFARIKVIGVGGGGCNSVSRMVRQKIKGIDFIGINTDAQALHHCKAPEKILIGKSVTRGLGAGMNIETGRQACEESREEVEETLKGADMVFITAGLGGGTGTPSAPIVADIARNTGALTVAIVTKPFSFEGEQRASIAEDGLSELKDKVDSLIVIPNDKVLTTIDEKVTLINAFSYVDNVLSQGVQAISDLIVKPGIVNVDFADVKTIMKDSGWALMGIGRAKGESRMEEAAHEAVNSPLIEVSIDGAKGLLFTIAGGEDLTMSEVNEGSKMITKSVDSDAKIIFGAVMDEALRKNEVKVTVIATGFNNIPEIKPKINKSGLTSRREDEEEKEEKDEGSEWDVPAFLRRKGKNEEKEEKD